MTVNRVFVRGDTHRKFNWLPDWCKSSHTTEEDILIILGDAGINYELNEQDDAIKKKIAACPITLLCIQGNHEKRPEPAMGYKTLNLELEDIEGSYWYQPEYPNILFMKNGLHKIKGNTFLVIDGAYSVDKYYRLDRGSKWFEDEQMSQEDENYLLTLVPKINYTVDYVLTHTAPMDYEPLYLFLPFIDQSSVDKHTEWLIQELINSLPYGFGHLYFGHYHDDNIDFRSNMSILYNKIIKLF